MNSAVTDEDLLARQAALQELAEFAAWLDRRGRGDAG